MLGDRYEVLETISSGPRATLHRAVDTKHDRVVALKVLTAVDATARDELVAETRMLLRLEVHSGLPRVRTDFTLEDGSPVIVMDWVDGVDLGAVLDERGAPGLVRSTVLGYVTQAAAALDHLHAHDPPIVHGDVKPSNLVLTATGKVVLLDFGIARLAGQTIGAGTRGFTAPEISTGSPCTPAADVYGLAATAYALLTGSPPTGRPDWDGIDPDEVVGLAVVLRRALSSDPRRRYTSAGEFAERLRAGRRALPSGLVTLAAFELADADELWDADAERMTDVCDRVGDLVTTAVDEGGGAMVAVEVGGSRILTVFTSPVRAIETVEVVRRRMRAIRWSPDQSLALRISLHTGEPEVRDGRYVGAVVAQVERLRARAPAGEILVSSTTAVLVGDGLPDGTRVDDGGPAPRPPSAAAPPSTRPPGTPAGVDPPRVAQLRAECADLEAAARRYLLQEHEAETAGQTPLAAGFAALAGQAAEQLAAKRRELEREATDRT